MTNLILPRRRLLVPAVVVGLAAATPAIAKPALILSPAIAERWEKAGVPAPSLMTGPALAMLMMAKTANMLVGGDAPKAPPTYVTGNYVQQGGAGFNVTVSSLSGVLAGDLIFVFCLVQHQTGSVSGPGFTLLADYQDTGFNHRYGILYKAAVGGETSVTVTLAADIARIVMVAVYRGAILGTVSSPFTAQNANSGVFPNITMVGGGLLVASQLLVTGFIGIGVTGGTSRVSVNPGTGLPGGGILDILSTAGSSSVFLSGGPDRTALYAFELLPA